MKTINSDNVEYSSIIEALDKEGVFSIFKDEDAGTFILTKDIDSWNFAELTKNEFLQLAEEIKELANK